MEHPETYIVTPDHGPWPCGRPDECISCGRKVGEEHGADCVLRSRTVVVRYTFEVVVVVPEYWTPDDIEFHRNESSWCANNAIEDLSRVKESCCLCSGAGCDYVREATLADEERFDLSDELGGKTIEKEMTDERRIV